MAVAGRGDNWADGVAFGLGAVDAAEAALRVGDGERASAIAVGLAETLAAPHAAQAVLSELEPAAWLEKQLLLAEVQDDPKYEAAPYKRPLPAPASAGQAAAARAAGGGGGRDGHVADVPCRRMERLAYYAARSAPF